MKYALIIGNNKYDDPKLAQLKTPAADSQALAKVLDDKSIGSFDEVTPLINQYETKVRRAVSTFLANKKPDDLVLLYFSGHGVLDDRGRLYLALKDTQYDLLKATSIPSSFVADEMDSCRSRRQILVLDCCHSGAFERGTKGEQKAITETTFEGSGFGRVVLTASDSTQYALEGDQVIKQTELSLFTHFLLQGLKTGEADMNNDGHIALDEWYDYTYAKVVAETPRQVPHKWSYNQQGDLIIARNPFLKKRVVELPYELVQALESPFVGIRESAVIEVGKYLKSRDSEMVDLAISSLEKMKNDDSRRISLLAEKLLSEFEQARVPVKQVAPSKPRVEMETEATSGVSEEAAIYSQSETSSIRIPEMHISRPVAGKANISSESQGASQRFAFDRLFWSKWMGTTILAIASSLVLFYYYTKINDSRDTLLILFGIAAGLTSLIQWFFFRNRLEFWWVPVNAVIGIGLGTLQESLFDHFDWGSEDVWNFLVIWVVVNFVLGMILLRRRTQEKSSESSSIVEIGARHNLFLLLLSVALVLTATSNILLALEKYNPLHTIGILYGISAILVSISFLQKTEIPRNFGFIALALFSLFDGINVEQITFHSEYPLYYFTFSGILALVSGVFFISHRETWKNFGFIMLSGYLIMTGLFGLVVYTDVALPVLVISSFFAIPAAIYFLLRK